MFDKKESRYFHLPRVPAFLILAAAGCLMVYGLLSIQYINEEKEKVGGGSDLELYETIVERIHAGEPYYEAAGGELRRRGYATVPFFNWRLPTLASFLGYLPDVNIAYALMMAFGLAGIVLWEKYWVDQEGLLRAILGGLILLPSCGFFFIKSAVFFHETWAGVLIFVSLGAYAQKKYHLCAGSAAAAVMVRELALFYLLMLIVFLTWRKLYRPALVGAAGAAAFLIYIWIHSQIVASLITEEALSKSWVRFNGWPFVLTTARPNGWLILLPHSVAAILIPLSVLGLIGWKSQFGALVAAALLTYMAFFSIAGQYNNEYWGVMYISIILTGLLYAPRSIMDLLHALRPRRIASDL
ncbi:MAG: hypothetical protein JXR73_04375 [Candidatus Omnitrophica bacterium]|nr:hypothetical protein [Candidatus Omnitrophota bacterium]